MNTFNNCLSTNGNLGKTIYEQNGKLYLVKGNSNGNHEAISEVLVSNLLDVLNINHIRYWLDSAYKYNIGSNTGKYVSICELLNINGSIEKASLWDFICSNYGITEENYTISKLETILLKLPTSLKDGVLNTLWVDSIVSNDDRHLGNFEIHYLIDGSYCMLPMFDFGMSLWYDYSKPNKWFRDKSRPFRKTHKVQMAFVNKHKRFQLNNTVENIINTWVVTSANVFKLLPEKHAQDIITGVRDRLAYYTC